MTNTSWLSFEVSSGMPSSSESKSSVPLKFPVTYTLSDESTATDMPLSSVVSPKLLAHTRFPDGSIFVTNTSNESLFDVRPTKLAGSGSKSTVPSKDPVT